MLRYIDSTPIFTREAPSLTYSEHLTSQTLQATFFFEPKDFASRPPPPADRRSGQIFSSRPMSPLRCTVAFEIFSKSCDGNPIENFFIGEGKFLPTRRPAYFFRAPDVFLERPTPRDRSVDRSERSAAPGRSPTRPSFFEPPDVPTPIHCRLRNFF